MQQERDTLVKTTEELRASLISLHQEGDVSRDRFDVLKKDCEEMGQLIEHQKQTIALLVDEKASLGSHVEELDELQTSMCFVYTLTPPAPLTIGM
ncbi:MAG TPA: hypothetical protein VGO47_10125 [Chlamydiales bacterium]|nr:hypothetical protein [Chlamydiales bacterium]